jgi:hypothetical protein
MPDEPGADEGALEDLHLGIAAACITAPLLTTRKVRGSSEPDARTAPLPEPDHHPV